MSREFAFLLNNWILLVCAFFVLFATMFPTLSEVLIAGERITVGPPFFNKWMTPIGLILLFLTGVGPLIAWRKTHARRTCATSSCPPVGARRRWTAALRAGRRSASALCCRRSCASRCARSSSPPSRRSSIRGTRVRQAHTKLDFFTSLIGLVARGKRRYGGYIVHLGVVLMFVGFAGDAYKREEQVLLDAGPGGDARPLRGEARGAHGHRRRPEADDHRRV